MPRQLIKNSESFDFDLVLSEVEEFVDEFDVCKPEAERDHWSPRADWITELSHVAKQDMNRVSHEWVAQVECSIQELRRVLVSDPSSNLDSLLRTW